MIPISIENVTKTFGPVRALDDVSLDIAAGELFFLLGPSGCGKTTLLRTIAGFYEPDRGVVKFGNRDVTRLAPQKRDTAMVFQNYALWPHMSVAANVAFGLAVRKVSRSERKKRTAEALEMVHMGEYGRRKPNQLSGGQQQRVALARALVVKPRCLLLDEPLSNLDAKLRLEMRGEIRRLCKEFGLTAVYVTHDQKEALSIADRMAVMFSGKVAQVGTPAELYRSPNSAAVADFLGETNFLDATVVSTNDTRTTLETPLGRLTAARSADLSEGIRCQLSIRPEAVHVALSSSAAQSPSVQAGQGGSHDSLAGERPVNWVSGKIVNRVYLGEAAQLTIAIGSVMLTANVTEYAGVDTLEPGAAVDCRIDARDIVILRT